MRNSTGDGHYLLFFDKLLAWDSKILVIKNEEVGAGSLKYNG